MMSSSPLVLWFMYAGAGLLLTLAISFLSKRWKVALGRLLPPNWASIVHVPIAWVGFVLYLNGYFLAGSLLMGFSGGLDKFDGMAARAFDKLVGTPLKSENFWDQMFHRGTTPLGKILDPLADKVTMIPIYLIVAYVMMERALKGCAEQEWYFLILAFGLILLMLIADFAGQVFRMKRFHRWHAREDKSATLVGKVKSAAQWAWLGLFPIWHQNWLAEDREAYLLLLNFLLAVMLALAAMSASSKIKPVREIWNGQSAHG